MRHDYFLSVQGTSAMGMENCRIIELTDDTPWNPAEVNIAMVLDTRDLPPIEVSTYQQIRYMNQMSLVVPTDSASQSDLSVFDAHMMIQRLVQSVNIATSYHEHPLSHLWVRKTAILKSPPKRNVKCGIEMAQQMLKTTMQRGL
jgi:hypothetical protein